MGPVQLKIVLYLEKVTQKLSGLCLGMEIREVSMLGLVSGIWILQNKGLPRYKRCLMKFPVGLLIARGKISHSDRVNTVMSKRGRQCSICKLYGAVRNERNAFTARFQKWYTFYLLRTELEPFLKRKHLTYRILQPFSSFEFVVKHQYVQFFKWYNDILFPW